MISGMFTDESQKTLRRFAHTQKKEKERKKKQRKLFTFQASPMTEG